MAKRIFIIFSIGLLLFITVKPYESSANPLLRIAVGGVAEKAVIGIAEKAGVKYATKTAQETAVKRWNLDLIEKYNIEQAENKVLYENLVQRMNNPTPIPEKPGFGKILLDGAMFITGADILVDGYKAFQNAVNGKILVDDPNVTFEKAYQEVFNFAIVMSSSGYPMLFKDGKYTGTAWVPMEGYTYSVSLHSDGSSVYTNVWRNGIYIGQNYHGTATINDSNSFNTEVPSVQPQEVVSNFVMDAMINGGEPLPELMPTNDIEIIVPLNNPELPYEIGTNTVIEPKAPEPEPQPKYKPNPNYNPELAPSIDNPMYLPNPEYEPSKPPAIDPTGDPLFDPITGETNTPTEEQPNPDDYTVPDTATLNIQPLLGALGDIKNKFPFSIPWDLAKQLSVFNVEPQAPKIDIDFSEFPYAKADTKLTIDLSFMDPLAVAARWFLTIAFDIAIILGIRKLLPE